jgi:hypothetical protein
MLFCYYYFACVCVVFLEEYFSVFKENLYILLILDAKKKKKERKTQGRNGLHFPKIVIKGLDNPTCCRIIESYQEPSQTCFF